MFSLLNNKFEELLTCTDKIRTKELLEYIKSNYYLCCKIIRLEPHVGYRDEVIQHVINHFNIKNVWLDLRHIISKEQKESILKKLEYFPNFCYDLIVDKCYDSENELNYLLIGLRKSIGYILDFFDSQNKNNMLSFEYNYWLYQEILDNNTPKILVETLVRTKGISEIRKLIFEKIIINNELAKFVINEIEILTRLKEHEKKVFYEKYRNDIFSKYKSTKIGYIKYCTSFKEYIGFREKKLYINKILKHMRGIEIKRHLNLLSYSGESKDYLDSMLIINKLGERG